MGPVFIHPFLPVNPLPLRPNIELCRVMNQGLHLAHVPLPRLPPAPRLASGQFHGLASPVQIFLAQLLLLREAIVGDVVGVLVLDVLQN